MDAFLNSFAHELVNAILVALLAGISAAIKFAWDKWSLERTGMKQEQAQAYARSLVLAAEEKIEALAKKGMVPAAEKAETKLESVISALMMKYPKMTREQADTLAHEAVATVGVGAANFLVKLLQATKG